MHLRAEIKGAGSAAAELVLRRGAATEESAAGWRSRGPVEAPKDFGADLRPDDICGCFIHRPQLRRVVVEHPEWAKLQVVVGPFMRDRTCQQERSVVRMIMVG